MATTYYAPDPIQSTQFIPGSATPANGGQLFFYLSGSSTKQTVYKDNAAATAWSNPILLDSGGNLPSGGEVWFAAGVTYKVVFAPAIDSDPPSSPYWTKDNLSGANDVSSTASEWIAGAAPTFVSTTSFTLVGDQTATYTVGRRVRTTNTGGTVYGTIIGSNFGSVTTVVVATDSGVLDSGLSAVAYSILGTANSSVPRATQAARPDIRGRLTLTSGQPITSSDVTSATAVVFTPYQGNTIDLYDGSGAWRTVVFSSMSIAVPATTAVHDVFVGMNSSGALALTSAAWANVTTRATNLTTQSGVYVQTGDTTKLYLGTYFGTTISGTSFAQDSAQHRCLWNYWNRIDRRMFKTATSGSYVAPVGSSGVWSVYQGDSTNALRAVFGEIASMDVHVASIGKAVTVTSVASDILAAVCVDAFNNGSSGIVSKGACPADTSYGGITGVYQGEPGIGMHTFAWVQMFNSLTSFTFLGSSSSFSPGITGITQG